MAENQDKQEEPTEQQETESCVVCFKPSIIYSIG